MDTEHRVKVCKLCKWSCGILVPGETCPLCGGEMQVKAISMRSDYSGDKMQSYRTCRLCRAIDTPMNALSTFTINFKDLGSTYTCTLCISCRHRVENAVEHNSEKVLEWVKDKLAKYS